MTTGLTRDAGWNMGVRRTVGVPLEDVWLHLVGDGLTTWLGDCTLPRHPGDWYRTTDGTIGQLRSRTEQRRLRLTWQPDGADHDTTLQVTALRATRGTTIAFHQERMSSAEERERMLEHWTAVVRRLVEELGPGSGDVRKRSLDAREEPLDAREEGRNDAETRQSALDDRLRAKEERTSSASDRAVLADRTGDDDPQYPAS